MTDFGSTARRRELGAELRRIRESCGINGNDMAARLHWSASTLSRAETGKRPMTVIEVANYLGQCGVSGEQMEELLELASESDEYRLKPHLGRMPDQLRSLIYHETSARIIESYEPIFIPGHLQVTEYSRALIETYGTADPEKIPTWLEIRQARRRVLTRRDPAHCTFFIHENALRMPVGNAEVMHEQMLQLLFAGNRPQCTIRVIPVDAGPRGVAQGPIVIFGYEEGSPLVYLEHETTSAFLENDRELVSYRALLKRVATVALTEAQSREFISWLASEYEHQGVSQHEYHAESPAELA